MRIYSALYDDYCHFDKYFKDSERQTISGPNIKHKGLLILHGGADISPSLYGEPNIAAHAGTQPSSRDLREIAMLDFWLEKKWPVFGICRGMQLLTARLGGKLIQHVNNHAGGSHEMVTDTGDVLQVNSAHHQMCDISKVDGAKLVGWTPTKLSDVYIAGLEPEKEPEAVHFQKHNQCQNANTTH